MTTSERIADHIAGVAMGLILAALAAGLMNWLWSEMRVPVFFVFLIYWTFNSIDTSIAERAGLMRTSASGWRYFRARDIKNADPRTCVWGDIASIISGIGIGFIVAGLVGLLWPTTKWLVFFLVFGLWTTTIVIGMVNAWRNWSPDL
jgi:hypothetical protein